MNRHDLASDYIHQYEDTDVTVIDYTEFHGGVVFDLSDGAHWFMDHHDTCQVAESLVDSKIGWNENDGYVIVNDDGSVSRIDWLD